MSPWAKLQVCVVLNLGPPLDVWGLSPSLFSWWTNRFYIYSGLAFALSLWICLQIIFKKQVSLSLFLIGEFLGIRFHREFRVKISQGFRKIQKS
jgi:hypothetical protein